MTEEEARELAFVLLDHRWSGKGDWSHGGEGIERCDCGVWLSAREEWADHVVTEYQRSLTAMANRTEVERTEPAEWNGNPY